MSDETRGPLEVFVRKSDADREIDRLTVRVAELQEEVERMRKEVDVQATRERSADRRAKKWQEDYLVARARLTELEAREVTPTRDMALKFMSIVEDYGGGKRDGEGRIVVDVDDVLAALICLNAALRSPATEEGVENA